jgi:hypothetical protein
VPSFSYSAGESGGPHVVTAGFGPGSAFSISHYPVRTFGIDTQSITCRLFGP